MDSIWTAIITVVGTGVIGSFGWLLGLIITGRLVPASRVADAEREGRDKLAEISRRTDAKIIELRSAVEKAEEVAATWKASHDSIKVAFDGQTALLERQQLTAEITDKAMQAVKEMLGSSGGGQ